MNAARSTRRIAALALSLGVLACSRHPAQAPAATPVAATPAPAPTAPAPTAPDLPGYEVRLGREVYQHYCQICHGDTGAGDGFNAFNLDPRPRDLSDPDFQKKKTDADLHDAILRGGAGVGLSPLMPPWGRTLSARQMDDVILYLRTLKHAGS
jgi:mono/diheme cytochrome c family protein